jgi:hypothetical protein
VWRLYSIDDGWMTVWGALKEQQGKKWRTQRTCISGTLSTINPTWTGQRSNLGLCNNRVANSHLKPITASRSKMWFYQKCNFSSHNNATLQIAFLCNRNPAPNWNPVTSPDLFNYIHITQNGLQPGQGIFKERSKFLETLSIITKYTTSDKDEL